MSKSRERQQSSALVEWHKYYGEGAKGLFRLRQQFGDAKAALLTHQRFEGNASLCAEFLTVGRTTIRQWWQKHGLPCIGKYAGRRTQKSRLMQTQFPERSIEEWIQAYMAQSGAREQAFVNEWIVPPKATEVPLVVLSDLHVGSTECDFAKLMRHIDWIKAHPEVRWMLGGDQLDTPTKSSHGIFSEQFCPAEVAIDILVHILEPIRDQGILVVGGNHEQRIWRDTGVSLNPSQLVAERLGLPFVLMQAHIVHHLRDKRGKLLQEYVHYHHHGVGAARTMAAQLQMALKVAEMTRAELVTVGHLHVRLSAEVIQLAPRPVEGGEEDEYVVQDEVQKVVQVPGYRKSTGYPRYTARKPVKTGMVVIWLGVDDHHIRDK